MLLIIRYRFSKVTEKGSKLELKCMLLLAGALLFCLYLHIALNGYYYLSHGKGKKKKKCKVLPVACHEGTERRKGYNCATL